LICVSALLPHRFEAGARGLPYRKVFDIKQLPVAYLLGSGFSYVEVGSFRIAATGNVIAQDLFCAKLKL
jgi:hypothetical protein